MEPQMMAKAPPSFDLFVNDWHGGTKHLSMLDRACYFELLLYQWSNGHIPEDPQVRMHLCGMSEDSWRAIWGRIRDKFEPKELPDGRVVLVNPRMDIDRDEAIALWKPRKDVSDARRRAGKKGGIESGRSRRSSKTPISIGSNPRSKNEAKTKQNEAKWEGGRRKEEGGSITDERSKVGTDSGGTRSTPKSGTRLTQAVVDSELGRLPEKIRPTVREWIQYKADEKAKPYKPLGLKKLITRIANALEHVSQATMIAAIDRAMSDNYEGFWHNITLPGDAKPPTAYEERRQQIRERREQQEAMAQRAAQAKRDAGAKESREEAKQFKRSAMTSRDLGIDVVVKGVE